MRGVGKWGKILRRESRGVKVNGGRGSRGSYGKLGEVREIRGV